MIPPGKTCAHKDCGALLEGCKFQVHRQHGVFYDGNETIEVLVVQCDACRRLTILCDHEHANKILKSATRAGLTPRRPRERDGEETQ